MSLYGQYFKDKWTVKDNIITFDGEVISPFKLIGTINNTDTEIKGNVFINWSPGAKRQEKTGTFIMNKTQ